MKLTVKAGLIVGIAAVVLASSITYLVNGYVARWVQRSMDDSARYLELIAVENISENIARSDYVEANLTLFGLAKDFPYMGYLVVTDKNLIHPMVNGRYGYDYYSYVSSVHQTSGKAENSAKDSRIIRLVGVSFYDYTFPILDGEWTIHLGLLTDLRDQAFAQIDMLLVLLDLYAVLVGAMLILFFSHYVSGPIQRVSRAAEVIASGNLRITIPVRGKDEVANLATSFNLMAQKLRVSYEGLEQAVRLRTQELSVALKKSQQLSAFVENSFEAFAMIDYGKENKLRYVNPAWERMTGYTSDEVINSHSGLVIEAIKNHPDLEKRFWDAVRTGGTFSGIMSLHRKDGSMLPVEVYAMPIASEDGKVVWMDTIRDISKQKEAEERVREQNELRNKFIQVVSHQLRTPINAVRWNLESLMSESLGKLKKEQMEFLRLTYEADMEVVDRLNDLLTAMDIEEGRIVLSATQSSIESLLTSVLSTWKPEAVRRNIKLTYKEPLRQIPEMMIDIEKIRKVLTVLIENALTYTRDGGSISLCLKQQNGLVRFEISDTGVGIPEQELRHIFARFYRASNAAVMKTDASGLGLSIAKSYIEQHGGKIGCLSIEGKGSTFWFEVPLENN
jgi:PAS domain S-box-containing protein